MSAPIVPGTDKPLVERSSVEPVKDYAEYRTTLRFDFFYACAYCTMCEAEASAIRFTIDHYEPRKARPDLVNEYANLMYACDECNKRKGDRCPPAAARADGVRFFRPDYDVRSVHFDSIDLRLKSKSKVGDFTIEALDLNRLQLRRLRELRQRAKFCDEAVMHGLEHLRRFKVERLPSKVRLGALQAISRTEKQAAAMAQSVDDVLRRFAASMLIDNDNDPERQRARREALGNFEGMYPGSWRAPRDAKK